MATHEEAMFPELEGLRSSRSYAVHPACERCHRLYPEMRFIPSVSVMWPVGTKCCGTPQADWYFLVGTRKGKINLTVRSRVAAVQKRGVWAALGM